VQKWVSSYIHLSYKGGINQCKIRKFSLDSFSHMLTYDFLSHNYLSKIAKGFEARVWRISQGLHAFGEYLIIIS